MLRCTLTVAFLSLCFEFATAQNSAIAIVNGRTITRKEFDDFLVASRGVHALRQLIVAELAETEAARRGFRVTDADVQREYQSSLERFFPPDQRGGQMTSEEREKALKQLLVEKGMTRAEFDLAMKRNVCLRRIVEADFTVDEATLREVFARNYGEKVQVRHVQIRAGDFAKLQTAREMLENGTDFLEIVEKFSENPDSREKGGLLPPFSYRDDEMPEVLREAAFSLKVGEVSAQPIQAGNMYHILKMDRRIPPADVTFESVREEVLREVKDRNTVVMMNKHLQELWDKMDLRILHGDLHRGFEEAMKEAAAGQMSATP
ncbi:MAG: peptidyl-prolyl cis-trans isomerase [Phycisphaerae bacterium]